MKWTIIAGTWTADDNETAPPPPRLPALNPTTKKPWKNGERYDDTPAQAVAQFAPGWHEGNYALQHANQRTHSILIDTHQKKHVTSWLSQYHGAPGTKFPKAWTNQDVINYAELLIPHVEDFATTPAANTILNNIRLDVGHQPDKKERVGKVIINTATWNAGVRGWYFHFYPA